MKDVAIAFLIILFFTSVIFGQSLIDMYRAELLLEAYKAELDAGFESSDSRVIESLKYFYSENEK